jgi:hypothetical protein
MAVFHGCILFDDKNRTSAPEMHAILGIIRGEPFCECERAVTKKDGLNLFAQITDFLERYSRVRRLISIPTTILTIKNKAASEAGTPKASQE